MPNHVDSLRTMPTLPFLWALSPLLPCLTAIRHDVALRHADRDDVTFAAGLLWEAQGSSPADCAVTCISDVNCVSFTLSARGASGRRQCRGHSLIADDLGAGVTSQGARLYSLKDRAVAYTAASWHESWCETDTDCGPTNSVCFANKCLCTPGYYYSVGAHSCVLNCSQSQLQSRVVEYPLYFIYGHNSLALKTSFRECVSLCVTSVTCRSLDYRYSSNQCSTSSLTPLDVPEAWTPSDPANNLNYYQRLCA
ncbi:uncharacterized protein LOC143282290 [Babylonia areolata]|uniref:uncharacterized protein LOC143282290 n=1 Tax=Babylonia areolata TaxID=304850 RepID=UPI003FD6A1A9